MTSAPPPPAPPALTDAAMIEPDPIRLPARPVAPARPAFPVIACVAPLVAAGVIWWITGSALVLVFAALSPVIAVAGLLDGRRSTSRQRRRDTAEYALAMTAAEEQVDHRLAGLHRTAWSAAPSVHRLLGTLDDPGRWADPAPVTVVLGAGPAPSGLRVERGDAAEHRALRARAAQLTSAPITVDPAGGIGLVGPAVVVRSLARSLVVQLVGQLSPRTVSLSVPAAEHWAWAARLPHSPATPHHATTAAMRLTVVESDLPTTPAASSSTPDGGLCIALADTVAGLPPGCGTIVRAHGAGEAEMIRLAGRPCAMRFAPILVAEQQVDDLGVVLTREAEAAGLVGRDAVLPAVVAFAPLCSAPPGVPESGADASGGLACVIGMGARGGLEVDLAADGPHALVGGTTGSGKSELLVTWVTSLAARYPPDQVTFLLVDFKGGAAFDPLRELPHCVGLITDLEEHEAMRALASLAAELRHRERVLREAGARDVTDPRSGGGLPRLVIVVDEFATMLGAFPALHALFVDIAARGRSLGVHLVLCTQRPAGVVRDALLANCSLRLSLRVNNRADSQAVLGSDAAAELDAGLPGRCVVRRGPAAVESCHVATTTAADVRAVVAAVARSTPSAVPPRRPWLDPLPLLVTASSLARLAPGPRVPGLLLGLLDEPDRQRYRVAGYDPVADGNLLVLGGGGTGKSTLLTGLAAQAPRRAARVPADVENTWDALVRARNDLDRPDQVSRSRLLLLDDVDAVLARWGEEHRAAAIDLLTGLLRDGAAGGLRLVLTVQRLSGALQALPALCQSRLVLRLPTVYEHQAAGEPAAGYDDTLPPGGGHWRGRRIQLLQPEHRDRLDRAGAEDPPVGVPSALAEAAASTLLVVAGSPARTAAAIRAAGPPGAHAVVELGAVSGSAGGRLEVTEVVAGTVLVADVDTWQAHWALLGGLRQVAPVLFDGCSIADFRAVTRRRDLPPPLAPARARGWLLRPDGVVRRVAVP